MYIEIDELKIRIQSQVFIFLMFSCMYEMSIYFYLIPVIH
jgi:hypothetical protein